MLAFDGSFAIGRHLTCDETEHLDQVGQLKQPPDRWNFVPAFAIDRVPVPCNAYQACVSEGRCPQRELTSCTGPERVIVDHDAALAYCRQRGARLPTYVEWQRAVRGIQGDLYPTGDTWDEARGCFLTVEPPYPATGRRPPRPSGCQHTSFDGVVYQTLSREHAEWTNDTACSPDGNVGPAAAYIWDAELNKVTPSYKQGQFRCARSAWGIPQIEVDDASKRGAL
ncbi:MAG: SUMF1/EgtB/PvdO family nonheme iron enzyme [Deltaproteobacteria bacterium]|nr:SUMF1/EgtB/PvdO family nonheme iron enzyme [Deltaproteobacteria bacterium]